MQKTIQLFEQDFARWGLHIPEADAAAWQSGVLHEAGWHVLYDFGQDSRGEFLDYYAALRDTTDPAVTDDWHVRLYETGDRVQLPTVLEAYMYARDPTPEELARARRKFANPQAPTAAPMPATPRPASRQPASPQPASPQPASPRPASPHPARPHPARPHPASSPPAAVPSATTALDEPSPASDDIALEVGLDLALAGVEPAPGGDTLASWLMTPAFGSAIIESGKAAASPPNPAPSPQRKPAPPADDDSRASDLVFTSEQPPAHTSVRTSDRISDRISSPAAITADDDTFTISVGDDEAPDEVRCVSQGATVEGLDHYHTPTRSSGGSAAPHALTADALAFEAEPVSPDDEDAASIPPAERRHSSAPNAMLTTDIAVVAGSFEPWWYRPTTRRIALAAAVIAVILVAVSHFRSSPAPDAAPSRSSGPAAAAHAAVAHVGTAPAPDCAGDSADVCGATGSAQPDEDSAPDTLPVASTPSSETADPANPAADDGIARPAGPQSMPPIEPSGTPRAPLGTGRTTAKAGSALP